MRGTSLVQGTIVLNFSSESNEEPYAIMDEELDLLIHMTYTDFERNTDSKSPYAINDHTKGYILGDVQIISRNQTINPSPENIVEVLNFVAKSFTQY